MKRILLSLGLLIVTAVGARADGISVSQAIDQFDIDFEDSVTFEITLTWSGPQSAYQIRGPLKPTFRKLKIGRFESAITSEGVRENETTYRTYRYILVPLASGEALIEPVDIPFVSLADTTEGELTTEPMAITIANPKPLPEKSDSGITTTWIWIVIIVVLAGAGGIVIYTRRVRREDLGEKPKSPSEVVLEQLEQLRQDAGDDLKKFHAGLYRILSGYARAEYGLNIEELGDDEVRSGLEKTDLTPARAERLADWLITARLDKFRPVESSPGETVRRTTAVREFFEKL